MNAQQIIDEIHGSYSIGSKNGLENISRLMEKIGELSAGEPGLVPSRKCRIIHVAGTNGKGSVCAMLESVLRHAGYSTGMYTSPFLQHYQERIRFDGIPVDDERMVKYGEKVLSASRLLQAEGVSATPFELGTALAFSAFAGEKVDAAIIEVGMGGRLDPTNIIVPSVSAIASIGMDHMQFLGETLEEIAAEKAGIIKKNVPVVCQCAQESVENVFAARAKQMSSPIYQLHKQQILSAKTDMYGSVASFQLDRLWENMELSLPGNHQVLNAMTVLKIIEVLQCQGMTIPEDAVRTGLKSTVWPGRLEWCDNILIDGGHNAQGIASLLDFVKAHLKGKHTILFSGVLSEKLHDKMLISLSELADEAVTVTPNTPRAMSAEDYAASLKSAGINAQPCSSVEEGLVVARNLAGKDGIIIASGSLYFVGELRSVLGLPWR